MYLNFQILYPKDGMAKNNKKSLFAFAIVISVFIIIILSYSVFDFKRIRMQMETERLNTGLNIIAYFEASLKIGLRGKSVWNDRKLKQLIQATCEKTPIKSFAFVYPSLRVYEASCNSVTNYYDQNITNYYKTLKTKNYISGFSRSECHGDEKTFYVVKPLMLDNKKSMGRLTFKFYQMLLNPANTKKLIKEFKVFRNEMNVRSLPLIIVTLPATEIQKVTKQFVIKSVKTGLSYLLFGCFLIVTAAKIQKSHITEQALEQAKEENEKLLKSLQRSDRLITLGRTAAALAHEIRNPLSSIRGFTQLFKKNSTDSKMRENADIVIKEVDRLNSVITGMLNFSQPIEPQFEKSNPYDFVKHSVVLIEKDAVARNIKINYNIPENLPLALVDKNLITQAFLNLFINAMDAMPNGGELLVDAELTSENSVVIKVKDSGKGISEESFKEIFQPYFTTKATGTGLGLATVDNIIAEHSGSIRVESEQGKSTTFFIELPVR